MREGVDFFSLTSEFSVSYFPKRICFKGSQEKKKTFNVTDTNSDRFLLFLGLPKGQQISLLHPAGRVKRFVIQWTLPLTRAAFQSVNDLS